MFVYQPALDTLDSKKEEGSDYVFLVGNQGRGWEWGEGRERGNCYTSKLKT